MRLKRVFELGVGPQPIRRTQLEPKGLAAAIEALAQDEKLAAAIRLGEQIRHRTGV